MMAPEHLTKVTFTPTPFDKTWQTLNFHANIRREKTYKTNNTNA